MVVIYLTERSFERSLEVVVCPIIVLKNKNDYQLCIKSTKLNVKRIIFTPSRREIYKFPINLKEKTINNIGNGGKTTIYNYKKNVKKKM